MTHPNGQYTFRILDHVTVRVTSKVSHAHGLSLSLQLLHCGPATLHSDWTPPEKKGEERIETDSRRDVVKVSCSKKALLLVLAWSIMGQPATVSLEGVWSHSKAILPFRPYPYPKPYGFPSKLG